MENGIIMEDPRAGYLSDEQKVRVAALRDERESVMRRLNEISREIDSIMSSYPLEKMPIGGYVRFCDDRVNEKCTYVGLVKSVSVKRTGGNAWAVFVVGNFICIPDGGPPYAEEDVVVYPKDVSAMLDSVEVLGREGAEVVLQGLKDRIVEGFIEYLELS